MASAIAIITRWRWPPESWCGIGVEPLRRIGDADLVEQLDGAGARGGGVARPRWSVSISVICRSMVWSGLSEVIGSWKIIEMSLPRTPRSSRSLERSAGRGP